MSLEPVWSLQAGLAAVGDAKLVVIGGIAELISGSISMGVGGYLSAQAERKLPNHAVPSLQWKR